MTDKIKLHERLRDIAVRSEKMKMAVVNPQFEGGVLIGDSGSRFSAVSGALMLASADGGMGMDQATADMVSGSWCTALVDYADQNNGDAPCDELLAAAHQTTENLLNYMGTPAATNSRAGMMLASAGDSLATSAGILERSRIIATILPVYLRCSTNHAVTLIPAGKDLAEIFRLTSIAASTSGEYAKNDVIAEGSMGQFTQQRQRYIFPVASQPDNVIKQHNFDTAADLPSLKTHAVKNGSVVIFHDRKRVAKEVDGQLFGSVVIGEVTHTLSGSVDHLGGTVTLISNVAISAGELHLQFEIDIEADPSLIPTISHKMSVVSVYPYEVSVNSQSSLQSLHKMRREHGIDTESLFIRTMTNLVAYETDTRRLRDMAFAATSLSTFNKYVAENAYFKEKYEEFNEFMTVIDSQVTQANKKSGIIGAYVGLNASAFIQSLGSSFKHVPNYKRIPQVHLVGTLYGKYRIYEVPTPLEDLGTDDILWYAKGDNHGDSGYVAGTAIPPISFKHDVSGNLVHSDTMWGTEYGEVHPDNGAAYFAKTTITNNAPV
jgi:hypothetical protein